MCEEGEEKRSGLLVCWWGDEAVMCRPGAAVTELLSNATTGPESVYE